MIRRIYIDNYKCLVDFECQFDNINLIMGTNGSGKSTIFEALRDIRDVVIGKSPISLFNESTCTRWKNRDVQTFELDVEGYGGLYRYRLEVAHQIGHDKQQVQLESLTYTGNLIYRAKLGALEVFHDDYSPVPSVPLGDRSMSLLPYISSDSDAWGKITWFKGWIREKLICLQIDPRRMTPMSDTAEASLDGDAQNFVAWYRHFVSADMSVTSSLFESLKEMFDDFQGLTLEKEGGSVQHLCAGMRVKVKEDQTPKPPLKNLLIHALVKYSLSELSDGERALIVLYTLLHLMNDTDVTLCLDEPDNYLALSEIQPWLLNLKDKIDEYSSQALLISHHPELINYLAPEHALIFAREKNGAAAVRPFRADEGEEFLSPAEIVARGWE